MRDTTPALPQYDLDGVQARSVFAKVGILHFVETLLNPAIISCAFLSHRQFLTPPEQRCGFFSYRLMDCLSARSIFVICDLGLEWHHGGDYADILRCTKVRIHVSTDGLFRYSRRVRSGRLACILAGEADFPNRGCYHSPRGVRLN